VDLFCKARCAGTGFAGGAMRASMESAELQTLLLIKVHEFIRGEKLQSMALGQLEDGDCCSQQRGVENAKFLRIISG